MVEARNRRLSHDHDGGGSTPNALHNYVPDEIYPYTMSELKKQPLAYMLLTASRWTPMNSASLYTELKCSCW